MHKLHISEVFRVTGWIEGSSEHEGLLVKFDAVEIEGSVWLVPAWKITPDGRRKQPERAIRLSPIHLGYPLDPENRHTMLIGLPKSVLDGSSTDEFSVVELPHILVQTDSH